MRSVKAALTLAGMCLAAASLATPALAQSAQREVTWYGRLTETVISVWRTASRPGDFSNRRNVARFVRGIRDPLTRMHLAKLKTRAALRPIANSPACHPGVAAPSDATAAVADLAALRAELERAILRLGRAVRPLNMERPMRDLAASLGQLYDDKSWVRDVRRFCDLQSQERLRFVRQIDNSISALGEAEVRLDALLAGLRG